MLANLTTLVRGGITHTMDDAYEAGRKAVDPPFRSLEKGLRLLLGYEVTFRRENGMVCLRVTASDRLLLQFPADSPEGLHDFIRGAQGRKAELRGVWVPKDFYDY